MEIRQDQDHAMEMLLQAFQGVCGNKPRSTHQILWTEGLPVSRRTAVSASILSVGDEGQAGNPPTPGHETALHKRGLYSLQPQGLSIQGPEGHVSGPRSCVCKGFRETVPWGTSSGSLGSVLNPVLKS